MYRELIELGHRFEQIVRDEKNYTEGQALRGDVVNICVNNIKKLLGTS